MFVFFFNDTATTEIYTLSLHDALPISGSMHATWPRNQARRPASTSPTTPRRSCDTPLPDRKSTRLNSSHLVISYAVFCLTKKIISEAQNSPTRKTTITSGFETL